MKYFFTAFSVICIFYLFPICAQNYKTLNEKTIKWSEGSGWISYASPGNQLYGLEISIEGTVIFDSIDYNSSLVIDGYEENDEGIITVDSGDSLTINGDLIVEPGGKIIVKKNAVVQINGNLLNKGLSSLGTPYAGGDIINNGIIFVSGDYSQHAGATLTNGDSSIFTVEGIIDENKNYDSENSTLPIKLKSFTGVLTASSTIELNWATAKEENFSFFEIHRSVDNHAFEVIGYVTGTGNSNTEVEYNFTDDTPPFGLLKYRLKAVDIDDSFEIFQSIIIKNTFSNQIKAYPNPVSNTTDLRLLVPEKLSGNINKVDLQSTCGRMLYSQTNFDPAIDKININGLKEGMYILKVTYNGVTDILRIFKSQ